MYWYFVVHAICFLLALAFTVVLEKQITVGSLAWTLICGPFGLAICLFMAMFTEVDPVIWKRK